MKYTLLTGFLYSYRIITDSVARNPVDRDLHLPGESTVKNRVCGRLSAQVSIELYQIRLRWHDIKSAANKFDMRGYLRRT
ncbi:MULTISPECIES: hypothetical protein [unclassified Microcoleus]|uniref:hypothetical protein n=1 Tax=unclassified Microcoleus TaxID=2642155 RepID=UPI002FD55769